MMERYDNRQKEVGFELNYYYDIAALTGQPSAKTKTNIYSGMNFTMLFQHAWSCSEMKKTIIRLVCDHRRNRGTYASGFLGALIRGTYEWRLAKH